MAEDLSGQGDAKLPSSPLDTSAEYDVHYEPIIYLPEVVVNTFEENEEELIKLRAKLFRYDSNESPPEWKERGTGEVKLLHNSERKTVRVVMRRDKTLKICANHFVATWMELKPNCGSDRAWVWSVPGDFADETPRNELFAIKFASAENAMKWKDKFEEAKVLVADGPVLDDSGHDEEDSNEEKEESDDEEQEEKTNDQVEDDAVTESLEKLKIANEETENCEVPEEKKKVDVEKPKLLEKSDLTEKIDKENSKEEIEL